MVIADAAGWHGVDTFLARPLPAMSVSEKIKPTKQTMLERRAARSVVLQGRRGFSRRRRQG